MEQRWEKDRARGVGGATASPGKRSFGQEASSIESFWKRWFKM
jgi:hypothetical protein